MSNKKPKTTRKPMKPTATYSVSPQEWDRTVTETIKALAIKNKYVTIDDVNEMLPKVSNPPRPVSAFMREMPAVLNKTNMLKIGKSGKKITLWESQILVNSTEFQSALTEPYSRPALTEAQQDDTDFIEDFLSFLADRKVVLATSSESTRFHKPLRELDTEEIDVVVESFTDYLIDREREFEVELGNL